jgi:hypothetical protein
VLSATVSSFLIKARFISTADMHTEEEEEEVKCQRKLE